MSTDKMREEFEAWASDRLGLTTRKLSSGLYQSFGMHTAWEAWQASRAAIEVDLREAYQKGWDESGEGWNAEYPGDCHLKESWQHQRDESLGLKVKP